MLILSCLESFSGRSQLRSGQHQKVVGDDRTPDVPDEALPALPGAAGKTKSALEGGDSGLNAGPEVAQSPVNSSALGHVGHRQPPLLGEHCILDQVLLGKGKIVLRGKAAIG